MKNIIKSAGIISILILIGVVFGCSEPENEPEAPMLTGTVLITGTAEVGQILQADTSNSDVINKLLPIITGTPEGFPVQYITEWKSICTVTAKITDSERFNQHYEEEKTQLGGFIMKTI